MPHQRARLLRNDTLMMLDNKKESGFSFEKSDSFTSLSFSAFRTEKTIDRQEETARPITRTYHKNDCQSDKDGIGILVDQFR